MIEKEMWCGQKSSWFKYTEKRIDIQQPKNREFKKNEKLAADSAV